MDVGDSIGVNTHQKMDLTIIYPWFILFSQNGLCRVVFLCDGSSVHATLDKMPLHT
jgi:hypothetical protein